MGLLNQSQPTNPPQEEPASPEEQREYDNVVNTALTFIFDKDSNERIVQMMRGSDDPIQTVANLAVSVGDVYEKRNGKISDEVAGDAAAEVIEVLFDLGEKAGAWESREEDMEMALYKVYELWGESHQGELQTASSEMAEQFQQIPEERVNQAMGQFARREPVAVGVEQAVRSY